MWDAKLAEAIAECIKRVADMRSDSDVMLEENPGVYVTVRNCDEPEYEYRIDVDTKEVKFRVDSSDWKRIEL